MGAAAIPCALDKEAPLRSGHDAESSITITSFRDANAGSTDGMVAMSKEYTMACSVAMKFAIRFSRSMCVSIVP